MRVYLVQHAEALSEEINPDRPLSEVGRQHANDVAALAARMDVTVQQIRHSGKTRAAQTAHIFGSKLGVENVVQSDGLGPVDDVVPVAEELDQLDDPVMLVGHLPFMERIAGQLLVGDAEQPVVQFNNAGLVCLEKTDERWQVLWIILPETARI
jgi:phosphohistidine phosphatase